MMAYLFSLLLVPMFPELESPNLVHGSALLNIRQQLRPDSGLIAPPGPVAEVRSADETLSLASAKLPTITGRIFGWSSSQAVQEAMQLAAISRSVSALRYTGMIESAGQKAGILSNGQEEYVVGVGSYLLDHYKVVFMNKAKIVLMPLDQRTGGQSLELNLVEAPGVRGS